MTNDVGSYSNRIRLDLHFLIISIHDSLEPEHRDKKIFAICFCGCIWKHQHRVMRQNPIYKCSIQEFIWFLVQIQRSFNVSKRNLWLVWLKLILLMWCGCCCRCCWWWVLMHEKCSADEKQNRNSSQWEEMKKSKRYVCIPHDKSSVISYVFATSSTWMIFLSAGGAKKITVEIEAKAKEVAVGKLRTELKNGEPEATWFVYILRCANGLLYTGITNDLPRRLERHNAGTASR